MYFPVFLLVNESPNSSRKTSAFMNNLPKQWYNNLFFGFLEKLSQKWDLCCLLDWFRVLEFSAGELPVAIVGEEGRKEFNALPCYQRPSI